MGQWYTILETVIITWLSALMFAVGSVGFYRSTISAGPRIFILLVGAILIIPGLYTDLIGLTAFATLVFWQKLITKKTRKLLLYAIIVALGSFILGLPLLVFAQSRWITQPIINLLKVIEDIRNKGTDFKGRVETSAKDEIGKLSSAFNEMMDRLWASQREIKEVSGYSHSWQQCWPFPFPV